jgi:hypothetical protein
VDVAAEAIMEVFENFHSSASRLPKLANSQPSSSQSVSLTKNEVENNLLNSEVYEEIPVYHILNPDMTRRWSDLLSFVQDYEAEGQGSGRRLSGNIQLVSAQEWLSRLEDMRNGENGQQHSALKLLGLWKDAVSVRFLPPLLSIFYLFLHFVLRSYFDLFSLCRPFDCSAAIHFPRLHL